MTLQKSRKSLEICNILTMINYCRLSGLIVQDERFSLSASHPLAIYLSPVHLNESAVRLH